MSTTKLAVCAWPAASLGDALAALARHAGLSRGAESAAAVPIDALDDAERLDRWIERMALAIGFEAEPTDTSYPDLARTLRGAAPALVRIPETGFVLIVGASRSTATLLDLSLRETRVPIESIRRALCRTIEAPLLPEAEAMLASAGVRGRRREAGAYAVLREQLSWHRIGGIWLARPLPSAPFSAHLRAIGARRRLASLLGAHLLQYLLWLGGWWLVGRAALEGRLDAGWLIAWSLVLLTIVPLRMLETWLQGVLSIGIGAALKARLLQGALALEPDETRRMGSGQLLGQVIESEAIESMALGGGFAALVALVEIVLAVCVLAVGAGGLVHAALLVAWTALALWLGWRYYCARASWTSQRLDVTHDLVERMIGHRTRLAQEHPERRHEEEDRSVDEYLERSRSIDRSAATIEALVPRGWLVVALVGLLPALVRNDDPTSIAVSVGGMLLAMLALGRLALGIVGVAGAMISWRQISHLFGAAARERAGGATGIAIVDGAAADTTLLSATDLHFAYRTDGRAVLRGASLAIDAGDRILLEGSSGGGKSTLASLLVGIRTPSAGTLMLRGIDRHAHGDDAWRRRVVSAPQFHDNHVVMGTFAFNLLMGRAWPPAPADLEEAETVCRELGLGDLLERMPAGLMQNVGETGWQLSQGERSRLFIARALLQRADVIILDESFGALDPETLRTSLACVFDRAPALLVIAHP
jgi:ATP-binding cassette subfamily B protein